MKEIHLPWYSRIFQVEPWFDVIFWFSFPGARPKVSLHSETASEAVVAEQRVNQIWIRTLIFLLICWYFSIELQHGQLWMFFLLSELKEAGTFRVLLVKHVYILATHCLTAVQGRELSENSRQSQMNTYHIYIYTYIYTHIILYQCIYLYIHSTSMQQAFPLCFNVFLRMGRLHQTSTNYQDSKEATILANLTGKKERAWNCFGRILRVQDLVWQWRSSWPTSPYPKCFWDA